MNKKDTMNKIEQAMQTAMFKAYDALSRYKFLMFGYHAAQWVTLNKLLKKPQHNPFKIFVQSAKGTMEDANRAAHGLS